MSLFLTLNVLYRGATKTFIRRKRFRREKERCLQVLFVKNGYIWFSISTSFSVLKWCQYTSVSVQCFLFLLNTYLDMNKKQSLNGTMACRHHHGKLHRKLLHFWHQKQSGKCISEALLSYVGSVLFRTI